MMMSSGTYLYEPSERGRLCVIRYKGPHYTGCGDVVARNVELELARRIVLLLNAGDVGSQTAAERASIKTEMDSMIERMNRALGQADAEAERCGNIENENDRLKAINSELLAALQGIDGIIENVRGMPDCDDPTWCSELCGNPWCNEYGCIPNKVRAIRAAITKAIRGAS